MARGDRAAAAARRARAELAALTETAQLMAAAPDVTDPAYLARRIAELQEQAPATEAGPDHD